MSSGESQVRKSSVATLGDLLALKQSGEKIAVLTAYDASFAAHMQAAGVDVLLVGDTLGMVVQGQTSTLPVSMDDMIYHCQAVRRGAPESWIIGDMPFLSFANPERALENAGLLMAEGGVNMVKVEGAGQVIDCVREMTSHGIPVCAHLGLLPQSVHQLGGYRVQGRDRTSAKEIIHDALALQDAGASLLVLECIPATLANEVSRELNIPAIGIGAGPGCDGQVLVSYDILGLYPGRQPRFARNFLQETGTVPAALSAYVQAVKSGEYPAEEHSFS